MTLRTTNSYVCATNYFTKSLSFVLIPYLGFCLHIDTSYYGPKVCFRVCLFECD